MTLEDFLKALAVELTEWMSPSRIRYRAEGKEVQCRGSVDDWHTSSYSVNATNIYKALVADPTSAPAMALGDPGALRPRCAKVFLEGYRE